MTIKSDTRTGKTLSSCSRGARIGWRTKRARRNALAETRGEMLPIPCQIHPMSKGGRRTTWASGCAQLVAEHLLSTLMSAAAIVAISHVPPRFVERGRESLFTLVCQSVQHFERDDFSGSTKLAGAQSSLAKRSPGQSVGKEIASLSTGAALLQEALRSHGSGHTRCASLALASRAEHVARRDRRW